MTHHVEAGSRNVREPCATLSVYVSSIIVTHDYIVTSKDIVEVKTNLHALESAFCNLALVSQTEVRLREARQRAEL